MMGRFIGAGLAATLSLQSASAAVVTYDNSDGTFFWEIGLRSLDGIYRYGTYLDITQPPEQTGEKRPGTITQWYHANSSSSYPARRYLDCEGDGIATSETENPVLLPWQDEMLYVRPTRDYASGEYVQGLDNWRDQSTYYWHLPFSSDLTTGTPGISQDAYVGVSVKMADNQWHYGWIHFVDYKTPVAWAYETEPNVPIQIPVPSPSVATMLVACCTTAIAARSRR